MKKVLCLLLMMLFCGVYAQDVLLDLEFDQKKIDALDAWKRKPFKVVDVDGKKCIYMKGKGGIAIPVNLEKYVGKQFVIFANVKFKDVPQTKKNVNGFKLALFGKAGDGSYTGGQQLFFGSSDWREVKRKLPRIKQGTSTGHIFIDSTGGEIWISELVIEAE